MSLHVLANHMASKGRDGDSMLVHMTPGEVHGLQALAMKHGGSLTINPDTGLPEANFLKSLLPIIAGFALGPAGFGLMSAGMAGLTVGGVTALATGSLQKGLMAGLGAYGGAGLGGGLSELGAGELAQQGISESMPTLAEGATQTQIADYAKQVNDLRTAGLESASKLPMADKLSAGFSSASASPMDAFNFAKDNKMALGMAAAPIMADMMVPTTTKSAPVQSPGRIVEKRWDGRQFVPVASTDASVFNASGRTFSDPYRGYNNGGIVALAEGGAVPGYAMGGAMPNMREFMDKTGITDPTEASNLLYGVVGSNKDTRDWGSIMSSADPVAAAKAATSQMYTSPTGNAGYVKLDDTGTSGMLYSGSGVPLTSDLSRADEFGIAYTPQAATNTAATNTAATNTGANTNLNFSSGVELANNAPSAGALYAAANNVNVGANINKFIQDNPSATADQINTAIKNAGMTQADINPYLTANTNISDAVRYALSHANEMPGAGGLAGLNANIMKEFGTPNLTQGKIDALQTKYGVSDDDIKNPLSGGSQVPDADIGKAQAYLADKKNSDVKAWIDSKEGKDYLAANPQFDLNDIAYTHYQRFGKYEGRKWGAPTAVTTVVGGTGNDTITGTGTTTTVPSGYHLENGVLVKNIDATQNTSTNVTVPTDLFTAPATSLPVGVAGNTGPSQIGGGATVNPNGTITTSPRIPGIPVGGFTGMTSLRDAYTKGGGSLGYTSPKFDKIEDFNAKYVDKRLTGDSRAAYDYLTGKAGAKYPTKSGVGQISEDYATAVLGYPARGNLPYIYNKETGKMDVNPDYVAPGRDAAGNVTYSMSLNDIKSSLKETPLSGQALYDWAISNNLSAQQIADATGRSLSSVYSDFRAGSKAAAKKKEDDKAAGINTLVDAGGTGDGDDGPGPGDGQGPGAGEGGGGASGDCVDPNVHILLADGGTVRAGDLKIGDMLYTLHDTTFVYGNYPVEYLNILQRPKVEAQFDDGQKIIISITHKFLTADNKWEKISDIEIGTSIRGFGDVTKKLVSITDVGTGPVVEMVVTEAHTYISEGLVSHNKYYGGLVNGKANGGMAYAMGGATGYALGGLGTLGGYSDGGRLLRGPGDGVSDSIPATIGRKQQPARLADGEFVVPARIVSELGNGSTDAGAKKLYAMMDRVQRARGKTTGKNKVAANSRADKYLPA